MNNPINSKEPISTIIKINYSKDKQFKSPNSSKMFLNKTIDNKLKADGNKQST